MTTMEATRAANRGALNEHERQKIVHCLYVAAERFDENAKTIRAEIKGDAYERLALQFDIQAEDARRWAELIENAEDVIVRG